MGSALFPLFKLFFKNSDDPAEMAWRTVCVVPAVVAFTTGVIVYFISDDAPKGNYRDLKKHGTMAEVSAAASFRSGACNLNTWLLFIQYGCCFGVELTMNNAAALYFSEEFEQSTESAAAIASIFGWMNLFARGLGGWASDYGNKRFGIRGRLWIQTILLLVEGALVLVFANTGSLGGSIIVMVFFSLCVQAAEGSTYGIVPCKFFIHILVSGFCSLLVGPFYHLPFSLHILTHAVFWCLQLFANFYSDIDPPSTGSIAGIVGAGGNSGAVAFGFAFRQLPEYREAFIAMGATILISAILTVFVNVKGHAGMICGKDDPTPGKQPQTLAVPTPAEAVEEVEDEEKPDEAAAVDAEAEEVEEKLAEGAPAEKSGDALEEQEA